MSNLDTLTAENQLIQSQLKLLAFFKDAITIQNWPEETKAGMIARIDNLLLPNEKRFVDAEEAARIIQVSPQTLKRWIKAGKVANYGKGRKYLVNLDELTAATKEG